MVSSYGRKGADSDSKVSRPELFRVTVSRLRFSRPFRDTLAGVSATFPGQVSVFRVGVGSGGDYRGVRSLPGPVTVEKGVQGTWD